MKKKILLINPRWGTAGGIWKGVHSVFPPIGLLSIAAVLEQAGHEVKVFDANVEDSAMYYKLYKPDVVGITITTTTANSGYATAKECKRLWPNCKTIMGGIHVSVCAEEASQMCDCAVVGESEETILKVINEDLRGVVYGNTVKDLNTLPMPAYHLIDTTKYHPATGGYKQLPAMLLVTSRGCPNKCLAGDTIINTVEGNIPIKDLVGREKIGVYSFNPKNKELLITDAINIRKVGTLNCVRVVFDDGSFVDCTPDHKFLTFKNSNQYAPYRQIPKEAATLTPGESVRSYNTYLDTKGYHTTYWCRRKKLTSHLVMEYKIGRKMKEKEIAHHIDRNKTNNLLSNLMLAKDDKEHFSFHPEINETLKKNNISLIEKSKLKTKLKIKIPNVLLNQSRSERMKRDNPSKYWTEESHLKASKAQQGKKRSFECRLKHRESMLGENNPNWKGGHSRRSTRIKEIYDKLKDKKEDNRNKLELVNSYEYNHKVVEVYPVGNKDVYDLEVPETNWFFANRVLVHNCVYCYQPFGNLIRQKSPENIMKEVRWLVEERGIRELSFYDDNFTTIKPNLLKFCALLKEYQLEEKKRITWSCFARVDWLDEEKIVAMKGAGCHTVLFGIESGNTHIREDICHKHLNLQKAFSVNDLLKKHGIETRASFIFGFPEDTVATMNETIETAIRLDPDVASFNILCPNPGTEVYELGVRNGWLKPGQWDSFDLATVVLKIPTATEQEILQAYKDAHRRFYFRPKFILRRLLKSFTPTGFKNNWNGLKAVFKTAY